MVHLLLVVYGGYNNKMLFIIVFYISRVPELFTSFGGNPHDRVTAYRTNLIHLMARSGKLTHLF